MFIQKIFHKNMIFARRNNNKLGIEVYSFLLGELSRINDGKEVSDEQAIKVLKKIKKSLEETMKFKDLDDKDKLIIMIVDEYLPKEISEDEIKKFISTIDFSQFKNKMQAMGVIMKHFGSNVDGNKVKEILQNS